MNKICQKLFSVFIIFFLLSACDDAQPSKQGRNLEASNANYYLINPRNAELLGLEIGQPKEAFQKVEFDFAVIETHTELGLEESYKLDREGVLVNLFFDQNNKVYEITSQSHRLKDIYGNGVGTSLNELKQSYPQGRFAVGQEEGRFANFITPGHVIFGFDIEDFPESCFSFPSQCEYDENNKPVSEIKVSAFDFTEYLQSLSDK